MLRTASGIEPLDGFGSEIYPLGGSGIHPLGGIVIIMMISAMLMRMLMMIMMNYDDDNDVVDDVVVDDDHYDDHYEPFGKNNHERMCEAVLNRRSLQSVQSLCRYWGIHSSMITTMITMLMITTMITTSSGLDPLGVTAADLTRSVFVEFHDFATLA